MPLARKRSEEPDTRVFNPFMVEEYLEYLFPEPMKPNHPPALVEVADLEEGRRTSFTDFMAQEAMKGDSD